MFQTKIYFVLIISLFLFEVASSQNTSCPIPNCLECSNDTSTENVSCLKCEPGFYYHREEQVCFFSFGCSQGEYKDPKDGKCYECSSDCAGCFGPESYYCTACPAGSYLAFYQNYRKCMSCLGYFCNECDEVGDCIICQKGYWLNKTSGDCMPCSVTDCEKCDNDLNVCEECKYGFTYIQQTHSCEVRSPCPLGKYNNYIQNQTCSSCDISCRNCYGPGLQDCYECAFGYYFNNNSECVPCNSSCADCNFDAEYCVQCNSPFKLRGQDCVSACAADEYYDQKEQKCKKCGILCGTCQDSPDYCLSCSDEVNYKLVNNTCKSKCGEGMYVPLNYYQYLDFINQELKQFINDSYTSINQTYNGKCNFCKLPCKNCKFGPDFCTECISPLNLHITTGKCYSNCPKGSYQKFDLSSNTSYCLQCESSCLECSNYTYCNKCATPYTGINGTCFYNHTKLGVCEDYEFQIGSLCLDECPKNSISNGQMCFCNETCNFCVYYFMNNFVSCEECKNRSYFSYNGVCLQQCPETTWIYDDNFERNNLPPDPNHDDHDHDHDPNHDRDHDRNHRRILKELSLYDSRNENHKRNLQYFIQSNYCFDNCPTEFLRLYQNNTRRCTRKCPQGMQNYQGTCIITSCPKGTYFNPFNSTNSTSLANLTQEEYYALFCVKCDSSCEICNGPTAYNCIKCVPGNYLQTNQSLKSDQVLGLFQDSFVGSRDISQKLLNFYSSFGAFCKSTCPLEFIAGNDGLCILCISGCEACYPPLKKLNGKCVVNCPENSKYNESKNECDVYYYLELVLLNGMPINQNLNYVSFSRDAKLELRIKDDIGTYQSLNITNLTCTIKSDNDSVEYDLFVRAYEYAFLVYYFSIPEKYFYPDTKYNVRCSVALANSIQKVLKIDYPIFTFPKPKGNFSVFPTEGASLENLTIEINGWYTDQKLNSLLLNYEMKLVLNNTEEIYLLQLKDKSQGESYKLNYIFPVVKEKTFGKLQLTVFNYFIEEFSFKNITISPQNSTFNLSTINFQGISKENLNIYVSAFVQENKNLVSIQSKLKTTGEEIYKTLNNQYFYSCTNQIDCMFGVCKAYITDPNQKCSCYDGYNGTDCSWPLSKLENSRVFFTKTLDYLNNLTQQSENSLIINNILSNLGSFPDVFNENLLLKSFKLLKLVSNSIKNQEETLEFANTLNKFMNIMKLVKLTASSDIYKGFIEDLQYCIAETMNSVIGAFNQSAKTNFQINTDNIKISLQSLEYLVQNKSNVIRSGYLNNSAFPTVTISLDSNSSSYVNYYCEDLYIKTLQTSSYVLNDNNNSRFFSDILSIEMLKKNNQSFILAKGNNFTLNISKIIKLSSLAASDSEASKIYSCLYYNTQNKSWSTDGLKFIKEGDSWIQCVSEHLTDFSVQLTPNDSIIYDYFGGLVDHNDGVNNDERRGDKKDILIISIIYCILSFIFISSYFCIYFKKGYIAVNNYDMTNNNERVGNLKSLSPMKVEIRAISDKEGGTVIAGLEQAKVEDKYNII